jgi:hypothetical protein
LISLFHFQLPLPKFNSVYFLLPATSSRIPNTLQPKMSLVKYQKTFLTTSLLIISLLDPIIVISLCFYSLYIPGSTAPKLDIAIMSILRSAILQLLTFSPQTNSLLLKLQIISCPSFILYCWIRRCIALEPEILASTIFSLVEFLFVISLVKPTMPILPISLCGVEDDEQSPLLGHRDSSIPSPTDFNHVLQFPQISLE